MAKTIRRCYFCRTKESESPTSFYNMFDCYPVCGRCQKDVMDILRNQIQMPLIITLNTEVNNNG